MSRYRQTMESALREVYKLNEEDHEVSMARGQLEAIADKALQLSSILKGKSEMGNPLEAWVQSKLTRAKDDITAVHDYMAYTPETNEETELEETFALYALKDYIDSRAPGGKRKKGDRVSGPMTYTQAVSKAKQLNVGSSVGGSKQVEARPLKEEVKLDEFTSDMIKRLQKSYSTMPKKISTEQAKALSKHLDRLDLVSLKQLVKANIPFVSVVAANKVYRKTGKFPLLSLKAGKFEEVMEELVEKTYGWTLVSKAKDLAKKFANNMSKAVDEIEKLEKGLSKNPSVEQELRKYNEEIDRPNPSNPNPNKDLDEGLIKDIYSMDQDGASVEEIAKKLKMNVATVKKILGEELTEEDEKSSDLNKEKELKIKLDKEKDTDALEKQMIALQGQVNLLKQKLENEKNKTIKPVPNKETGEVSLTFGIANKLLKDKAKKEEEKKPVEDVAESSTLKNSFKEERRLYVEAIAGLQKKADKSGMSYSILKKVYDRGMAAWKGGHRPGASQHQWAFARVNSFITKSSGTWGGADKDLAKQVKG